MSASTARGPYRKGIQRREQIMRSASAVFAEFGYTGGSVRTIATAVGVSPATLLQHFGSKEGLLEAVLDEWTRQTHELFVADLHGLPFFRALPAMMTFHEGHRGYIELFLTMAAEASSPAHPARSFIQQRYADLTEVFCRQLREACERGEIAALTEREMEAEVRMVIAAMDGLELQWLIDPRVELRRLFDEYMDQTINRWTVHAEVPTRGCSCPLEGG